MRGLLSAFITEEALVKKTAKVRTGQGPEKLSKTEFKLRFGARFFDPAFKDHGAAIDELAEVAWDGYNNSRKSPLTRRAGGKFKDPSYEVSVEWLAAKAAIDTANREHADAHKQPRILLICGSARNDKTCPGEMSKSYRLLKIAKTVLESHRNTVDVLDLSALTSEFGKTIYPCKGCVSTAMPLCHWPCSCYPNHSLGQVSDWMNEIYPRWVAAHGVMIITPVYWYQAPTVLNAMIDRMVCADGGNPDPSSTHGKTATEAKALELKGWDYPKHLEGRSYSVVVHGDSAGTENLRRSLTDWLNDMRLIQAGTDSCIDRFIDYYGDYATSHDAYEKDDALQEEVRNAARSLSTHVRQRREGMVPPDQKPQDPRPK
jgi:multimeric flavodoxin WrbA